MTYSVIWKLDAIRQLGLVESSADEPKVVRDAGLRVDFALRRYPKDMGESRDPGFRLWYEDVIGVYYKVDDTAFKVEVLFAGASRRR